MGFFSRRRKPDPPPPPPPAPAIQPPKPVVTPSTAIKGVDAQTGGAIKPGGASTQPTIQTSAQGVMQNAPLQYASLLGSMRKPGGM